MGEKNFANLDELIDFKDSLSKRAKNIEEILNDLEYDLNSVAEDVSEDLLEDYEELKSRLEALRDRFREAISLLEEANDLISDLLAGEPSDESKEAKINELETILESVDVILDEVENVLEDVEGDIRSFLSEF